MLVALELQATAAPFVNLGFELANTNAEPILGPTTDHYAAAKDLLFGWQLYRDAQPVELVGLNASSPAFSFMGGATLVTRDLKVPMFPTEGEIGLSLWERPENQERYTLVQRGDVPLWATQLAFTYQGFPFALSINGQEIPTKNSGGTFEPVTIVADISQFAGQNVELSLRTSGESPFGTLYGQHNIDDIRFVPEPSALAFCLLGGTTLLIALRRRRQSRRTAYD